MSFARQNIRAVRRSAALKRKRRRHFLFKQAEEQGLSRAISLHPSRENDKLMLVFFMPKLES